MNWAAISTVAVLLFLFGIYLQTSWQLENLLNRFGSQLEVSVFLDTGVQAADLKPVVAKLPGVTEVKTISKEAAWANLVKEMGVSDIASATRQLEGNPLTDELKVKAKSSRDMPKLTQQLTSIAGVDEVRYADEVVQRVAQLNRGLNWLSVLITALLTLTAIAVISTTIRLIVMARRREIEVMQLVGATTLWIYLPFILQGLFFGESGAAIAWGFILSMQHFLKSLLTQQPEFVQFLTNGWQLSQIQQILLPLTLLAFGGSIGLLGSLFAVRKAVVK
jgi:cell division transport system permease protein